MADSLLTFAFTDIEGSTARWERDRPAMQDAVRRHDAILRAAITEHGGHVFKTIGDAFCSAFPLGSDHPATNAARKRSRHIVRRSRYAIVLSCLLVTSISREGRG